MPVLRYYKQPGLTSGAQEEVIKKIQEEVGPLLSSLATELCYYIETEQGNKSIISLQKGIIFTLIIRTDRSEQTV